MKATSPTPSVKLWRAPDVMDAVMLKGQFVAHRYPPHTHDTHCLAVITGGTLAVEVRQERRLCRRGDVIVIDADVVHSGVAAGDGHWKMRVEHVQPAALAAYCERLGVPRRERFEVASPFIVDPELSRYLYGVNWCSEVDDDPFKRSEALACAVVGLRARHAARAGDLPVVRREPALVRAVKSRLCEDFLERVTLSTLASEFGVTPFVLLRAFEREAGMSPHAYQQQERVRHAMPMLRTGRPIAEVGARTGFADQSHFTRVFKQQTGVTPKVYQAAFS
ncbi:AraC family transcriptional regulator [Paraburkholderia sabiae]|jgi:AraC-like DNA-binding protein|uniref:AraC family transcriptional regulator n=1 Tax=Paraburkholderia sabiae TaxID=273251 RepID=A0ABU9Q653_9BURK|nr:AraC family transcriptional regulator [Paraburkholderia sabiae]WJZ78127.1 AraC family transcriptional regulator [Paraburkholderia sabiae]CAD6529007.1 HTH-type transcriptional activator RhaR [Paraburkholderia sabiae]